MLFTTCPWQQFLQLQHPSSQRFGQYPAMKRARTPPCRFIYEKAHELGVRSIILDGPDSWAQSLQEDGKIERFVPVDFADAESAFDRCVAAIHKVKAVSCFACAAAAQRVPAKAVASRSFVAVAEAVRAHGNVAG